MSACLDCYRCFSSISHDIYSILKISKTFIQVCALCQLCNERPWELCLDTCALGSSSGLGHYRSVRPLILPQICLSTKLIIVLPVNKVQVNVQYRMVALIFELINWVKLVGFADTNLYRRAGDHQWLPNPWQNAGFKWIFFSYADKSPTLKTKFETETLKPNIFPL